jgi:DNA-binding NarL/FixJ family response regulator
MNKPQGILIVDDNHSLREGLSSILSHFPAFDIVGEAADGVEALNSVERLLPDLVLMDISMPRMDGIAATREIKKNRPNTKVLVFTVHKTPEYLAAAHKAGADGYLLKDSSRAELIQSIEDILAGNQGFPQDFKELASL